MIPFHLYADLFPPIEGEAFADLVADVKANDVREKIVVLDGAILDGRNRYRAALEAGILEAEDGPDRPKYFTRFVPSIDGDPLKYVLSKNLHRRHLDDRQRASVAGKIANLSHGGDRSKPPIGGMPVEKAAAALNVAPRQAERARVVHEHGVEQVREALDRGDVAVSVAESIARLPEQEQPQALARALPHGARAIMSSRQEPDDSLDYFPTPPWATRALIECVLPTLHIHKLGAAWEPACGEGHIAEVLREYCLLVQATDVFDYGYAPRCLDFLAEDTTGDAEWIITNPPFGDKTEAFVLRSLQLARTGVAMFVRLQWLETIGRYERLFRDRPPTLISFFCERVNLCKGRWEPEGSTATAYIWLVWLKGASPRAPFWIPPGQRDALKRSDDVERFTAHPVIRAEHHPKPSPDAGDFSHASGVVAEPPASHPPPVKDAGVLRASANCFVEGK